MANASIPTSPLKGAIETLYLTPPDGSLVVCLDEMGPESAKTFAGQAAVDTRQRPAQRAKRESDYGRRAKGYVFGAFCPATGMAFTQDFRQRTIVNWIEFFERVDVWIPATCERVYAILDNLNAHHSEQVLLFALHHPRWKFVFQPKYAAYLNWIEPWWKALRSRALKGRRFETWEELVQAVHEATAYWNAHRHPFVWGKRRRHRTPRKPGVGLIPNVA